MNEPVEAVKRVRKRCSESGCENRAVSGGVCISHGAAQVRCSESGCEKQAVKGGVCVSHGAVVPRCASPGCWKQRQVGSFCKRHARDPISCKGVGCLVTFWPAMSDSPPYCSRCRPHYDDFKKRQKHQLRNTRRRFLGPPDPLPTADDLRRVELEHDEACAYCGRDLFYGTPDSDEDKSRQINWDHWLPVILGGRDIIENLVPACRDCNLSKKSKHPAAFDSILPFRMSERTDEAFLASVSYAPDVAEEWRRFYWEMDANSGMELAEAA